jgi:hypothetical protein
MVCDGDCDDADPGIGLPAEWFEDLDGDGWGAGVAVGPQCSSPGATYVSYLGDDCDDTDPLIYPGAYDLFGDGVDADCDGRDGACQEIAVGFLPGWGSLNDPSLEWTNLIANAANLGTCPLRVDEVGAGFTLADLQARNLDVLWSGDAAGTSIEYSNTEAQAISDFVNAGGGLVTSYVWSYTTSDNRFLAPLVGIDPTGVIAGTAVAQLPITVLDPTHPIARDVAPNFNLASYAFTQDSNPSLINALLPDTEVIMASTDDSNLLVAFDNGIWRGVAITTFTEYQVSNPNIQQVMYNAAAWAAGYDNP